MIFCTILCLLLQELCDGSNNTTRGYSSIESCALSFHSKPISTLSTNRTPHRYTITPRSRHASLLHHTLKTLGRSTLIRHISRQRQEVAVGRIGSHHVQIEVLEPVARLHLPHAVVRHLHEQLLCPRLVLRTVVLLLARQRALVVLYPSHASASPTQPRLLLLHRLPVRTLRAANRRRHLVPQATRLVGTFVGHVQHLLRQHRQLRHVQEQRLLRSITTPSLDVLLVGVRQIVLAVPVAVQVLQHLPVVRDNRGHTVQLTAEHGLRLTAPARRNLAVELDVGLVARLLALQHQFVDQLHAQRAEEQARARERRNDCVVLGLRRGTAATTSSNLGRNTSMLPSMEPQALLPVKCDFVQMYPFAQ